MRNLKRDSNGYVYETFNVTTTPEQGIAIAAILGIDADLVTELKIVAGSPAVVTAAVEETND